MSQQSSSGGPVSWHVSGQTQTMGRNAHGQWVTGFEVNFTLSNGTAGSVFVPMGDYNPDRVSQLIRERAGLMHSAGRLSGTL